MACEESFEIVPNKKAKSSVWNHFGFLKENDGPVNKTRVACKLCPVKTILKYSGNTTNLTDHLRRKYSKFLKEQSESTSSDAKAVTVTSTIFSAKLPHSSSRAKAISGAILQFMVKDLRPFSVVQNSGFQNLLHVLEPRYTIPSRQHFSDKALPELYEKKKTELKSNLAEAVAVALTTDGWTSRATESYVTIACNYIDKEWKLQSNVLRTRCLPESHTGVNISNVLREAVHEWNLPPNPPVVTDNASNMTVAAEELGTCLHAV
ncbi:E3 SUMO-protein ligase ZBED1 [Acropora cervicornis]|uniref:E3 SUMO-protein ligase ZBED1 n=1 Tax=Acropora cervicornis TaxID=6130 RepID=A0AAD9Q9W2_ACRCE|nr:E3 SUMO-protein ligase ZBED1 [Acropora cervicornis]